MIRREFILQRSVRVFVSRCVAVPHEFASHDRGYARSELEHIYEAQRGVRRDWPDVEIPLDGGRTFRCELKAPGIHLKDDGPQGRLLTRLNELGHPATWANSVVGFGEACERFGVPLKPNWRVSAQIADQHVLAEIAKQEAKAADKRALAEMAAQEAGGVSLSRPKPKRFGRSSKPSPAQIARVFGAMKPR